MYSNPEHPPDFMLNLTPCPEGALVISVLIRERAAAVKRTAITKNLFKKTNIIYDYDS
tara:strand:- start:4441 stop:4614 length:174 start_codon:yes stop_codon:yes gene_type:complete